MNRHWNRAADERFAWLLDGRDPGDPPSVIPLMFGPLRPHVANLMPGGP